MPLVAYGLQHRLIKFEDITHQVLATSSLPPHFFRRHIDALEAAFEGHPKLQKLAVNSFVGLLGRITQDASWSELYLSEAEASGKVASNTTGFNAHFRTIKSSHGEIYRVDYTQPKVAEGTAYPIYKQVLELEAVLLHGHREEILEKCRLDVAPCPVCKVVYKRLYIPTHIRTRHEDA